MAARLNKRQAKTTRDHIKANRHIEQLVKCTEGTYEMDSNQIRAAVFLVEQSIGKAPQTIDATVKKAWGLKL